MSKQTAATMRRIQACFPLALSCGKSAEVSRDRLVTFACLPLRGRMRGPGGHSTHATRCHSQPTVSSTIRTGANA
jgi:hypothetical protein